MCECVCVKFSHEKEKKILPFATMWMDIEHIMLIKINKRKTSAAWYHLYGELQQQHHTYIETERKVVARVWGIRERLVK